MPEPLEAGQAPAPEAPRVPEWLLQGQLAMCPCGCIGKRTKGSFVEKTLTGGADVMRQVMFTEDLAAQPGLLQRIDPRAKLFALLLLLVAAALVHHVWTLALMYVGTLVIAVLSRIPAPFFVKRVWLFIPVFTLIVVLPATLSIVTPGNVVLQLWTWDGQPEGFTQQGLTSAALITSRVAVSISLVVLLTLTTPWVRLLAALRSLGVPRIFILVVGMAYRYIFLLLGSVTDMYEARKARTIGSQHHDRHARAFVSATAGTLFGRASHLSEEVHQAMVARGYRGDARSLHPEVLRGRDLLFVGVAVALAALAVWGDGGTLGR